MYCPQCGTKLAISDASFCHNCGKSIATTSVAQAPLPKVLQFFPFTWVFWLLVICLFGAWAAYLLPVLAGRAVKGQLVLGPVVWTGGLFAYVWKRRYDKGWLGFGIGALVSIAIVVVVNFTQSYLRAQELLQSPPTINFVPDPQPGK
jgi:hypothetical protein